MRLCCIILLYNTIHYIVTYVCHRIQRITESGIGNENIKSMEVTFSQGKSYVLMETRATKQITPPETELNDIMLTSTKKLWTVVARMVITSLIILFWERFIHYRAQKAPQIVTVKHRSFSAVKLSERASENSPKRARASHRCFSASPVTN